MKKIPCLFQRDFADRRRPVLLRDVTPGCEWVLAGEGVATRKWDGTACLVRAGVLFARYDAKRGRTPPPGFEPCEASPDAETGSLPGWVPVTDDPAYCWHREAFRGTEADGSYELVGPKVNGNTERIAGPHWLARHGGVSYENAPRDFDGLGAFLAEQAIEGLVFHHPDGRMAKIRRDDYGLSWGIKAARR